MSTKQSPTGRGKKGVIHHHNYKEGLLEHTVQTIEIALVIVILFNLNDRINMDVLIAGAILHDIGKIN